MIHYKNDVKGITDGKPTHVVEKKKTFGDFTSKTIDTGAVGSRARKGVLNERQPDSSYLPPKGS
jgi:hypothetical protein